MKNSPRNLLNIKVSYVVHVYTRCFTIDLPFVGGETTRWDRSRDGWKQNELVFHSKLLFPIYPNFTRALQHLLHSLLLSTLCSWN